MSMFSQKKPYSAVTTSIENLTSEAYEEDDLSGIIELVEVIKLQATGPAEAARAIRKKLKYGNVHRQLRALTLLDGLISNAGPRFQRTFADEPLLERLRVCGTSNLSDPAVRKKCRELFISWAQYKKTPGLDRISRLQAELPKRKQVVTQERSRAVRESENPFGDDEEEDGKQTPASQASQTAKEPSRSPHAWMVGAANAYAHNQHARSSSASGGSFFGSSSKDKSKEKSKDKKKRKRKPFNLEAEKEQMKSDIAECSIATTNLNNTLQSINREKERISENQQAVQRFEECKGLRRKILRYIHHVEDEQWLGSLLNANDGLVLALMTFEQLDRSIDADSDSDDELAEQAHLYRLMTEKHQRAASQSPLDVSVLNIGSSSPPRPAPPPRPSDTSKPFSPASPTRAAGPSTASAHPPVSDSEEEVDDDDDNPFADKNAVTTPALESEPRW
ncbi:hypothetical protein SODALDRAFT_335315 [Sodiomyces alkalinus F11]|uniref:VHS domain-containing protein n=1 Tax=Sodiomyces alkalinus (strain CBS 110278 / VKM F-3762 / F11) TaxID=1314773 RepID=A0A3N2PNY9_SODAK|nr:hypothetical protein SODALDRAFT_335315 [Sodiomyces alkalinus F11]ROT36237.1 hypothetical protein SODALDRAFT_335315 [Sodiomyces alkalinus F11]